MTNLPVLPRLDPDQMSGAPLATSRWQSSQSVMRALYWTENDPEADSPILLGQLHDEKGKRHFMGFDDDRHITLIAGSRAGKGVGLILPNLLTYKGSVVCIDPKGENRSRRPQDGQAIEVRKKRLRQASPLAPQGSLINGASRVPNLPSLRSRAGRVIPLSLHRPCVCYPHPRREPRLH